MRHFAAAFLFVLNGTYTTYTYHRAEKGCEPKNFSHTAFKIAVHDLSYHTW